MPRRLKKRPLKPRHASRRVNRRQRTNSRPTSHRGVRICNRTAHRSRAAIARISRAHRRLTRSQRIPPRKLPPTHPRHRRKATRWRAKRRTRRPHPIRSRPMRSKCREPHPRAGNRCRASVRSPDRNHRIQARKRKTAQVRIRQSPDNRRVPKSSSDNRNPEINRAASRRRTTTSSKPHHRAIRLQATR